MEGWVCECVGMANSWPCRDDVIQHCVCVHKVSSASSGIDFARAQCGRWRAGVGMRCVERVRGWMGVGGVLGSNQMLAGCGMQVCHGSISSAVVCGGGRRACALCVVVREDSPSRVASQITLARKYCCGGVN